MQPRPALTALLDSRDLDELARCLGQLEPVTDDDRAVMVAVLNRWDNLRQVANLLFHPSVLPRDQVVRYLTQGLQDSHPYVRLAAATGIREVGPDYFLNWHREQLADLLIEALDAWEPEIAHQASISLVGMLDEDSIAKVERWLNAADPVVRRNVAVAYVSALGVERAAAAFRRALAERPLSEESRVAVEAAASEAERLAGEPSEQLWLSDLGAPALTYIPSFDEYASLADPDSRT